MRVKTTTAINQSVQHFSQQMALGVMYQHLKEQTGFLTTYISAI
jgi:hypothetical protein